MVGHGLHQTLAGCHKLGDCAEVLFGNINGDVLHRLVNNAVDNARNNLGFAHGHLKTFAAHLLNKDGEGEFASTLNLPGVRTLGGHDVD